MMEVTYAPRMMIRSRYYGADEFFEIQGTDGFLWVTRATGEMLDLPPVMVRHPDGTTTSYSTIDANWLTGFKRSSAHFVDALLEGRDDPEMSGSLAVKTLQLCFAVYAASAQRAPVDPSTITDTVSPPWWPPHLSKTLEFLERYGKE
jgi:predicted dehydrogenase